MAARGQICGDSADYIVFGAEDFVQRSEKDQLESLASALHLRRMRIPHRKCRGLLHDRYKPWVYHVAAGFDRAGACHSGAAPEVSLETPAHSAHLRLRTLSAVL